MASVLTTIDSSKMKQLRDDSPTIIKLIYEFGDMNKLLSVRYKKQKSFTFNTIELNVSTPKYFYDLGNFPMLKELFIVSAFKEQPFINVPQSLHTLSIENLYVVNFENFTSVKTLKLYSCNIKKFLEIIPKLNIEFLTTQFLVGENCEEFNQFVEVFATHHTWKYINHNFKIENYDEADNNCGLTDNFEIQSIKDSDYYTIPQLTKSASKL